MTYSMKGLNPDAMIHLQDVTWMNENLHRQLKCILIKSVLPYFVRKTKNLNRCVEDSLKYVPTVKHVFSLQLKKRR